MKNLSFTKKHVLFALMGVLLLSLPIACNEKGPVPKEVIGIWLNHITLLFEVGESQTLQATVLPEDAVDKEVSWTNSNPSVASFDTDNGTVTALSIGTTYITATAGRMSATCTVQVYSAKDGVVINDVIWANRNVDAPGVFSANPEDAGMFYQWNRKAGWSAADPLINSNGGTVWDATNPGGDTWSAANDPCPDGWRVPTLDEITTLLVANKVGNKWTTVNGINGCRFTDNATGASIFMPAAGSRDSEDGVLILDGSGGYYWSSVQFSTRNTHFLYFDSNGPVNDRYHRGSGFSVRCVAK